MHEATSQGNGYWLRLVQLGLAKTGLRLMLGVKLWHFIHCHTHILIPLPRILPYPLH